MSVVGRDDVLYESLEIRVLGPLRVRRADGTVVQAAEWLSSQTADLLRLLALRVNEPVPVDVLVEALWPKVDETKGRASLRNSASRLRKVLGEDCVQRRLDGMVLTGAWVDAHAFRTLAHQARREMLTGAWARVVTTTREAEAVYVGDFRAHHDADWASRERESLAVAYQVLLADAAEAAATLMWWHDAVDFAERSLQLEPCGERAFRVLMRAQRGLGETALALKTYDRCRRVLADEVGADPSPETQEQYLELLADAPLAEETPPLLGRAYETEWLRELVETSTATGEPAVVCVVGDAGSGKTRLVTEALSGPGRALTVVACSAETDPLPAVLAALDGDGSSTDVPTVLLDDAHRLTGPAVAALADRLTSLPGPACLVLAGRPELTDGRVQQVLAAAGPRGGVLTLPPLESEGIAELGAALLHGEVSEAMVTDVTARTGGLPGAVVALLRAWASSGRIAATSSGLVALHQQTAPGSEASVRHLLTQAVNQLPADALDLLHLVAVVGRPVTIEMLLPLTESVHLGGAGGGFAWLRRTLDHLTDLALLVPTATGLAPRDPLFNDLVLTWLRPSARRQLHRLVAERAHISAAERVEHWTRGGEPQLARAAAMDAAADAVGEHQFERARLHLRRLCHASETSHATPADRIEFLEQWGEAALQLGRVQEARSAFAAAVSTARAHHLPDLARLELRSVLAVDPLEGGALPAPAAAPGAGPGPGPSAAPADPTPTTGAESGADPWAAEGSPAGAAPRGADPVAAAPGADPPWAYPGAPTGSDDLVLRRRQAVRDADAAGDADARVRARRDLVWDVSIPRRKLRSVRRLTKQALSLDVDPALRAEILAGGWFAGAVVGDAAAVERSMEESGRRGAADVAATGPLLALQTLVAHDLGRRDVGALQAAAAAAGLLDDPSSFRWLAIRMATERGDRAAALRADAVPTPSTATPLVRSLRWCASAALAMELGHRDDARGWLLAVLEESRSTGTTLLVPEAAARLVVLEAHADLPAARRRFDQFEESVDNQVPFPREDVLRLVARAAMRSADRRPADAAAAAAAAADVAERAGLVHLAAFAHRHRAFHLSAAGSVHEARLAAAAEARWQRRGAGRTRRHGPDGTPETDPEPVRTGADRTG